jgi:hypothetical protein
MQHPSALPPPDSELPRAPARFHLWGPVAAAWLVFLALCTSVGSRFFGAIGERLGLGLGVVGFLPLLLAGIYAWYRWERGLDDERLLHWERSRTRTPERPTDWPA